MILVDFKCKECGLIEEKIVDNDVVTTECSKCGNETAKIFSPPGSVHTEYPAWLKDTLEVVDKTSDKPHVRRFLEDPSRTNYLAWMKGEGIRHLEDGEKPVRRSFNEELKIRSEATMRKLREMRRIEIS